MTKSHITTVAIGEAGKDYFAEATCSCGEWQYTTQTYYTESAARSAAKAAARVHRLRFGLE
jgi:hypothetical protein